MAQEDLTMKVINDGENRQTLLYGLGDQHLDIIAEIMPDAAPVIARMKIRLLCLHAYSPITIT